MKIQCSCGTKYAFDVTPEMAEKPVQFVCQNCGLDSSATVNEMIRKEFASLSAPAPDSPAATVSASSDAPPPPKPARIHISKTTHAAATAAAETASTSEICRRHPHHPIAHECVICKKPMCVKCMELFGYVCSPHCKARAEREGKHVPVFAGQRSVSERKMWRKAGLIAGSIGAVVAALIGGWVWFSFFGQAPKPIFAVRFPEGAISGASRLIGKDQLVFLHGGTLARHDIKQKKEIWSLGLIDENALREAAVKRQKEIADYAAVANMQPETDIRVPSVESLIESGREWAESALQLHVSSSNIWVLNGDKLVRHDWETGKPAAEVPMESYYGGMSLEGDELVIVDENDVGQKVVTRVSLSTGETREERFGAPREPVAMAARTARANSAQPRAIASGAGGQAAGLPSGRPGADGDQPLDPAKVAAQAQSLPLAARLALPATLSSHLNQERILKELNDHPRAPAGTRGQADPEPRIAFNFVPSRHGHLEYAVELLERKYVTRKAMKDPPAKSALSGNVNVTQTAEIANEILNEIQRSRGGDTVTEDVSRYRVVIRRADQTGSEFAGEVIGSPSVHPLKSINVISAGKSLVVLDKTNKKLWEASLTHRVPETGGGEEGDGTEGLGPCVERDGTLYVFDEAVLTCFDLLTGDVRWRLPSVGVTELFFDDKGMLYVNTTTASPEMLKFSRQIDINQTVTDLVAKIDPRTGKTLWASLGCSIAYMSGKYIFTIAAHHMEEGMISTGLEKPSYLVICRLNPKNGRIMWQHHQQRAPLDVQFQDNTIELVFRKEVQVLKFLTL